MEAAVFKFSECHLDRIFRALWLVDAGHVGKYGRCLSWSPVISCWRPPEGAAPYAGTVGQMFQGEETKVKVCCCTERLEKP